MLTKYITFLKAHQTLLIVGGFLYLVLTLGSKWLDHSAATATVKEVATQQVVTQDASQNKALAAQMTAQQAEYRQLAQTTTTQIAGLQAAILGRDAQTQAQQATDQALPLGGLATRWQNLLQLPPGDVVAGPSGQVVVSEPAARTTVEDLELGATLVQDVTDLKAENQAQAGQLTDLTKVNDLFGKQVMGLQGQLTDADKACKAQVAQVKAQARKSKLRWFGAGFVLGVVSKRLLLGAW